MEPNVQTAFIPKKPLTDSGASSKQSISLVMLICTIIFITVVAVGGVVYFFSLYFTKENKKLQEEVTKLEKEFMTPQLASIYRLDARLKSGRELLRGHLAPTLFLDFLAESTIRTVRFSSFNYAVSPEGVVTVSMNGQAGGFAAVAAQANEFNSQKSRAILSNPSITNLDLDKEGNVTFLFKSDIQRDSILYSKIVDDAAKRLGQQPSAATTTVPAATTTAQAATTTQR